MTRRSKRELERVLEKIDRRGSVGPTDVSVRAPFVTYGENSADFEVPEGCTSRTEHSDEGPTYHVVERDSGSSEAAR